jgi:SPP1 family predicted phage head-tail adaptor
MTGAGELDRRITIQRATVTLNEFNEPIETWGDLATVWAKRRDASATESYRAQEVGAEITARFTIRWSTTAASVTPRDRLSFDGRLYNITAVRDVGRNRLREIDAVARADEAAAVVP